MDRNYGSDYFPLKYMGFRLGEVLSTSAAGIIDEKTSNFTK
jgi:hypothetical protein